MAPYPSCLHCPVQKERGWTGYPNPPDPFLAPATPDRKTGGSSGGEIESCSKSSGGEIESCSKSSGGEIESCSKSSRSCCDSSLKELEMMLLTQSAPSETAAIFLEPVLGEGGFYTPPPGFMRRLRELCDKHKILLVADEVQSGVGRTGEWWGYQCFDHGAMQPDLLVFAKGIASGYPIAGVASRADAYDNLIPGSIVSVPFS